MKTEHGFVKPLKKMFLQIAVIFCSLPLFLSALLQNPADIASGYSKFSGLFATEMGVSARNLALGRAFTGLCDDYTAIYYNPAGIQGSGHIEGGTTYSFLQFDVRYYTIGFAFPFHPRFAAAFDLNGITLAEPVPRYDSFGIALGDTYTHSQNSFKLGISWLFFKHKTLGKMYTGANLKFIRFSLAEYSDFAFSSDIGYFWNIPVLKSSLGITVENLPPPKLTLSEGGDSYPLNLKTGVSTKIIHEELILTAGFDVIGLNTSDAVINVLAGAQWSPIRYLSVQAGWNFKEISAGAGFHIKGFTLGYAAVLGQELNHFVSLSKRFGITEDNLKNKLYMKEGDLTFREYRMEYEEKMKESEYEKASDILNQMIKNRKTYYGHVPKKIAEEKNIIEQKIEAENLYKIAESAAKDGQWPEAYTNIKKVYEIVPEFKKGEELKARAYNRHEIRQNLPEISNSINQKKWDNAYRLINYGLNMEPEYQKLLDYKKIVEPYIHKDLSVKKTEEALAFVKVREYEKAMRLVEEALSLWSENHDAAKVKTEIINERLQIKYNTAYGAYKNQEYKAAGKMIEEMKSVKNEGERFQELKDRIVKLEKVVNAGIYHNNARKYLEENRFDEAEAEIKKALKEDPSNEDIKETYERYQSLKSIME